MLSNATLVPPSWEPALPLSARGCVCVWPILCVMVTRPWYPQIKNYFCMFLVEISIWMGGLSKVNCPPRRGWASSNQLRVWVAQKGRGKPRMCLCSFWSHCVWAVTCHLIFSCLWTEICTIDTPGSQPFRLRWNSITSFSGVHLLQDRSRDFSASTIMCICHWLCFFGKP